jgi:hypothetical protein
MSVFKRITTVATTQFIIYEIVYLCNFCNYVAIKLLQLLCHYVTITIPLHCNYCVILLQCFCNYKINNVLMWQ